MIVILWILYAASVVAVYCVLLSEDNTLEMAFFGTIMAIVWPFSLACLILYKFFKWIYIKI